VLLFAAVLAIFGLLGRMPGIEVAWMPVLMTIPLALGLGLGLLLGVFNVFVRDIAQAVPVVLQLGFWFTPIVYLPSVLPPHLASLLRLNPMTPVVRSYQNVMVYGMAPLWSELAWVAALALALLFVVLFMFRRASADLVDAL
jgi:lipopolysaccharide transport system permease protein